MVFTDSNGDDKPDSKENLFTGISGTQHDHGIHAVHFGPDGKFYFNFGNSGRQIKDKDGKPIVDQGNEVNDKRKPYQQGMVFRCNEDGSDFETLGWNFRNNGKRPWTVSVPFGSPTTTTTATVAFASTTPWNLETTVTGVNFQARAGETSALTPKRRSSTPLASQRSRRDSELAANRSRFTHRHNGLRRHSFARGFSRSGHPLRCRSRVSSGRIPSRRAGRAMMPR